MAAGEVEAPRLDLENEELASTHLRAFCVSELGAAGIKDSVGDAIDADDIEGLPLQDTARNQYAIDKAKAEELLDSFALAIGDLGAGKPERRPELAEVVLKMSAEFDEAFGRWRTLYRDAEAQLLRAEAEIRAAPTKGDRRDMYDARRRLTLATSAKFQLLNKAYDAGGSGGAIGEFYPFRYLAAEGFLPGYNFTRLPARLALEVGDSVEYVERPRGIALSEFGPQNIVYHNGQKYRVDTLVLADGAFDLGRGAGCINSGYFLLEEEVEADNDPFTGVPIADAAERVDYGALVELGESKGHGVMRITCEEEDRTQEGYETRTWFRYPKGFEGLPHRCYAAEDQGLLNLRYLPACSIVTVNEGWRLGDQDSFWIDTRTGSSLRGSPSPKMGSAAANSDPNHYKRVRIFTTETADAVYIEPLHALNLAPDGRVTLAVRPTPVHRGTMAGQERDRRSLVGDPESPNILIYENAEGSLGILSDLVSDPEAISRVAAEPREICGFEDDSNRLKASYDDLLTYYNQREHARIDRFTIRNALGLLAGLRGEVRLGAGANYEARWHELREQVHAAASTEVRFLDALHERGLRLPTPLRTDGGVFACRPDFFYEPKVLLFCDGKPHDALSTREDDNRKRDALRERGWQVLVWRYDQDLGAFFGARPDVFKKVKS